MSCWASAKDLDSSHRKEKESLLQDHNKIILGRKPVTNCHHKLQLTLSTEVSSLIFLINYYFVSESNEIERNYKIDK